MDGKSSVRTMFMLMALLIQLEKVPRAGLRSAIFSEGSSALAESAVSALSALHNRM